MESVCTNFRVTATACLVALVAGCGSDSNTSSNESDTGVVVQDEPQVGLQAQGRFDACRVDQDFSDSVLPADSAWYEGSGGVCVKVCDPANAIVPDAGFDGWAIDESMGQRCLDIPDEETRFGAQVPIYDSVSLMPLDSYRVAGQRLYSRGDQWICSRETRASYQDLFSTNGGSLLYRFAGNGELSRANYDPELPVSEHDLQVLGYWASTNTFDERLAILSNLNSFDPEVVVGPVFENYTTSFYEANVASDVLTIFKTSDDKMVCERVRDPALNIPAIDRREYTEVDIAEVLNVPMNCDLFEQTYYNEVLHGGTRVSALVNYPELSYTATLTESDALTLEDTREIDASFVARSFEFGNEYRFISRTDNPQYNFMDRYAGLYMLASQTQTIARFRNGLSFFPASNNDDFLGALPNSHSAFHRLPGGDLVFEEILTDGGSTQVWEQVSLCRPVE